MLGCVLESPGAGAGAAQLWDESQSREQLCCFSRRKKPGKVPETLRSVEGTAEVDEEDGQGDFPARGCRCVTWATSATLEERQLTLSWESMGTHGHACTQQGQEGDSTGKKEL